MSLVQAPTTIVEVAFTTGADTGTLLQLDDPSRGKLNTGTLGSGAADEPVWTDVTAWAQSGTVNRGATRVDGPIVQYDPSTCSVVLDNTDRRFDPNNLDGPYVDPLNGTTLVTAMRAVRIRALWAGVYYNLFRGLVDMWDVQWDDPSDSLCTLTATDAFKVLAGIDRTAVTPLGGGEDTGARINRVLDSAGWPAADRSIATGDSTLQETDLSGDALAELRLDADSEIGELYMDGAGRVVFRNRRALLEDTRSTVSQGSFGDLVGEIPYRDLSIATDDATFYNEVTVTRAGGAEQTAVDTASQALFYRKTYRPGTDPILQTDADALAYAQWLLHVSADPELRFVSATLDPRYQPTDLYPQVLGREIGDRVTITRRPPGGGDPIVRDQFIRGISHSFAGLDWTTTWTFQDADRYGSFLVLDHATLGKLTSGNALAF